MVDTAPPDGRNFGRALADLATAQKSGAGVPAYTRYINRPLGRVAAALAYVLGMTPNQVTLLSGVCSAASIVAVALLAPGWTVSALVTAGLVIGYILDSADGQLARLRGGGNRAGEWLDHVVDAGRMPALHLGVLIGLYRFAAEQPTWTLLIPIGFLLVTTVRFFALMLAEQMKRAVGAATLPDQQGPLRSLLALPGDFGVLCVVFIVLPLSGTFLAFYGALFVLNAALMILSLFRRYRELVEIRP